MDNVSETVKSNGYMVEIAKRNKQCFKCSDNSVCMSDKKIGNYWYV